jgi:hypothetical protein
MSNNSSENNLPDFSKNVESLLNDIQSLQKIEQDLFQNLNTNANLTPQEQQKVIEKINQISNMRRNLYTTLSDINSFYKDALNSSIGTLKEQTTAINIVETELNRSKKRLEYLETQKNNKIRLVEINEYFGEKYSEHTKLMKVIIFTLIPIIILTILYKKELLPKKIYFILLIIVSIIGAFFFWRIYASIISRDNMNYNEYDWPFDINSAPAANTTNSSTDPWFSSSSNTFGTCVGQYCCSTGQTFDSSLNQCVGDSTVSTTSSSSSSSSSSTSSSSSSSDVTSFFGLNNTSESFQSMIKPANFIMNEDVLQTVLTKTQPGKYKMDANLAYTLKPYNS